MTAPAGKQEPAMRNAIFEAGWRMAAKWADRDDLYHDTTSAAYVNGRDAILAELDGLLAAAAVQAQRTRSFPLLPAHRRLSND